MIKITTKSKWDALVRYIDFLKMAMDIQRDQNSFIIEVMGLKFRRMELDLLWSTREWE